MVKSFDIFKKKENSLFCIILCCHFFSTQKLQLFENLEKVDPNVLSLRTKNQVFILLYGFQKNNSKSLNQEILKNLKSNYSF